MSAIHNTSELILGRIGGLFVPPRIRFTISLLAILAVLVAGAAGYMVIEGEQHPTFLDAVYMVVITLSTVGYQEAIPLSSGGRLWTILVIVVGIVTVSFAFTSLLSLVVGGELRSLREKKKMQKTIEHLSDHVVVCGYGRMGAMVASELRRQGVQVVVVEIDSGAEKSLRDDGLAYVIGDATEEDNLREAGIERARALVVLLPSDSDNVYVTLTAHTLYPDMNIVARAEQLSTEAKLLRAGATRVVCAQIIGATKIANILTRPTVVDFVEIANKGVDLEMDEYRIHERSPLVGQSLRDAGVRRKTGATVVAIKRSDGETLVNPNPDEQFRAEDIVILVGSVGVSSRLDAIEHDS
jgi:voltage-gated potassium channel